MRFFRVLALILFCTSPVFAQRLLPINNGVVTANVNDLGANNNVLSFQVILNQNVSSVVLSAPVPANGVIVTAIFTQDSIGGRTVAFGGNLTTTCSITTTANATTICRWQYNSTANSWGDAGGGTGSGTSAIRLVQTPGSFATFSAQTVFTQQFLSTNTANNLIVVFLSMSVGSSGNTATITDTDGDGFFQAGTSDIGISTIFYAIARGGALNTVTATLNGSSTGALAVAEYSGVNATHPLETATTFNGSNAQVVPLLAYINTPVAGSLFVVMGGNNGGGNSYFNFTGCNARTPSTNIVVMFCDNTNSVAGLNYYTWTQSGNNPDLILKTVSFLPATYSAPSTPALVRQTEGLASTNGAIQSTAASPATAVFPGGNLNGNFILLTTQQTGITDNITAVTDSEGNTYTRLTGGGDTADASAHRFYSTYIAPVTAGALSNNTISIAFSAGTIWFSAIEVSGITGIEDVNTNGLLPRSLTTTSNNDFVLSSNGFGGGGATWNGLSGFDIFGSPTVSNQMNVNYFISCQKTNPLTSTINNSAPATFTVAMLPTSATSSCPATTGSMAINNVATVLEGTCTGVAAAGSTLGFFGLGQNAARTCTSTVVDLGTVFSQVEVIQGIVVMAGTGGVNSSSGVVTLLKNGSALSPSMTCTLGTTIYCADLLHQAPFSPGDVISAQFTTQAAETLANVKIQVIKTP